MDWTFWSIKIFGCVGFQWMDKKSIEKILNIFKKKKYFEDTRKCYMGFEQYEDE